MTGISIYVAPSVNPSLYNGQKKSDRKTNNSLQHNTQKLD